MSSTQPERPPPPGPPRDPLDEHEERTKRCPLCAEEVLAEATVCRHCSYDWCTERLANAPSVRNGLAVASLVVGIFAMLSLPVVPVAAVASVIALCLGVVARRQINRSGGAQSGIELARAGVVLGWIALALAVVVTAMVLVTGVVSITVEGF